MKIPSSLQDLEKYSDYDLGRFIYADFIRIQAERFGINPHNPPDDFLEQVYKNIISEDSVDVKIIALEKALKKAATGDFEKAGMIFREHFKTLAVFKAALDESVTGRRRNKKFAQTKRPDNLQKLIIKIVEKKPQITETELFKELEKHVRQEIESIEEDDDGDLAIFFHPSKNKKLKSSKVKSLKHRLYNAKKT